MLKGKVKTNQYHPNNQYLTNNFYHRNNQYHPNNWNHPNNLYHSNNWYCPNNQYLTNNFYHPNKQYQPNNWNQPNNLYHSNSWYCPNNQYLTNNLYYPNNWYHPNIQYLTNNLYHPNNQYHPNNWYCPNNQYLTNNLYHPNNQYHPNNRCHPNNQYHSNKWYSLISCWFNHLAVKLKYDILGAFRCTSKWESFPMEDLRIWLNWMFFDLTTSLLWNLVFYHKDIFFFHHRVRSIKKWSIKKAYNLLWLGNVLVRCLHVKRIQKSTIVISIIGRNHILRVIIIVGVIIIGVCHNNWGLS